MTVPSLALYNSVNTTLLLGTILTIINIVLAISITTKNLDKALEDLKQLKLVEVLVTMLIVCISIIACFAFIYSIYNFGYAKGHFEAMTEIFVNHITHP